MRPLFIDESSYFRRFQPEEISDKKLNEQQTQKKTIWQTLYQKGLESKKIVEHRHFQHAQKLDQQCIFNPKLRSKSSKYFDQDAFVERNNIWLQNKTIRRIKQRQQQMGKEFKQCTFKPMINKNKHRKHKHQNSFIINDSQIKQAHKFSGYHQEEVPSKRVKKSKTPTKIQFLQIKNLIRKQLSKIRL